MAGVVGSLFLIIMGAIVRYAYSADVWTWTTNGEIHVLHIDTIGIIFLLAGIVGLLLTLLWGFFTPKDVKSSYIKIRNRRKRPEYEDIEHEEELS